jgi:hypothetical protein
MKTHLTHPAPEHLDLCDLYPMLKPYGVGATICLFVEQGQILIKTPEAGEDPDTETLDAIRTTLEGYQPGPPPAPPPPIPPSYRVLRAAAYEAEIPMGDQLDALAKGIDSPEWKAVVATRQAIKARFPKPTL